MAGLLDGEVRIDPLAMGLLAASQALATPRAMGGGFVAGMGAFQNGLLQGDQLQRAHAQDARREQLLQLQMQHQQMLMDEARRKVAEQAKLEQAARDAYTPASPGSLGGGVAPMSQQGVGLMGGMTRGASPEDQAFDAALRKSDNAVLNENAARQGAPTSGIVPPSAGGFDRSRFVSNLYRAGMPSEAMRVEDSLRKELPVEKLDPSKFTAESLAAFMASGGRDYSVLRPYVPPEKPAAPAEIEKLIAARNALPPDHPDRAVIDERIAALNYRQPPASMTVSYGAPFEGVDPTTGQRMLYQPNNRGGSPQSTGLAPPPKEQPPAPEAFNKAIAGINELNGALDNYEKVLKAAGGPNVLARGEDRAKLQAAYTRVQMGLKNAMELGALAGPDVEILGKFIQDPTSLNASVLIGGKGVLAQVGQARGYLTGREKALSQTYGRPNPAAAQTQQTPQQQSFPMLPNAAELDGKTVRDTVSGKRYKSQGGRWVEVQ